MVARIEETFYYLEPDGVTRKAYNFFQLVGPALTRVGVDFKLLTPDTTDPVDPGDGTNPLGYVQPYMYPFPNDSVWKTSIGSGATYMSTADSRHVKVFGTGGGNIQSTNWSETAYYAVAPDPDSLIRHLKYLPSGWAALNNQSIGVVLTASEEAATGISKNYVKINIPSNATWQSTTNTDRKILVVLGYAGSFDITNSAGTLLSTITFQAGEIAIDLHKFYRTSNPDLIYVTNLAQNNIRTGWGLTQGAIASGISAWGGVIRTHEVLSSNVTAIAHVLQMGLPNAKLVQGAIWPTRTQDGDAAASYGTTGVPYGTMMCLRSNYDVEAYSWDLDQKKLLKCLQDFGGYVGIRSGSGPVGIKVEAPALLTSSQLTDYKARVSKMTTVWQSVIASNDMRIITNSVPAGGFDGSRVPLVPANMAGGGTRRRAASPDFNPVGPW